jgi:MFS family permease
MAEVLTPAEEDWSQHPDQHPHQHLSAGRLISISAFWFATNVHWTALLLIVIPAQIAKIAGAHQATYLGLIGMIGSAMAIIIPLLVGPLSDRCMSKFGRRRPFIAAGVAVNLVGLACMFSFAQAQNFWGFLAGFVIVQIGNNIATGAYQGVIPDVVSPAQRGVASGYMGLMTQLGSTVGAVTASLIFAGKYSMTYATIAVTLIVFTLINVWGLREKPLMTAPAPINWKQFIKDLWIDPRKYPDFAWVWITRALVMFGFYTVQPFVLYYLRDVIHVENAEKDSGIMFLIILIAATITGLFGGWVSDRIGRKKIVYVANGLMAVMAFALVFCTTYMQALIVGVVFGLGYGAYVSVDWALGTDVLPSQEAAGKDMAVWHIAMVLPQTIAIPVAGFILSGFQAATTFDKDHNIIYHYTTKGYMMIFGIAAVALAIGAVLLRNVRSAK